AEAAGIPIEHYLSLGRDESAHGPVFSMTVLALRLSRFRNGVSALHGEVSRGMWSKIWPGFRQEETPITSVTNGIHTQTWVSPEFDELISDAIGEDWRDRLHQPSEWSGVRKIPDKHMWAAKNGLRHRLVDFVRVRTADQLRRNGASEKTIEKTVSNLLDPNAFTIGFARRFALYKRAALLFRDRKRAAAFFGSTKRPVQIIFAGKPHPEDPEGKKLFEEIQTISQLPAFRGKVVLLENYDIEVCRHMVYGVDIWLNNPRRPLEASGTSGQKVPVNGGLNVSILDGWWCEGYSESTGFAFGKPKDYSDHNQQDNEDNSGLLRCLEREVVPLFYKHNRSGLPKDWLKLVKTSMADLVPRFSTQTMVSNYVNELYAPAFENGRLLNGSKGRLAHELAEWRERVERSWPLAYIRSVTATKAGSGRSSKLSVEVEVYLAGVAPDEVFCSGDTGELWPVVSAQATPEGATRLRVRVPGPGAYRIFPSRSGLVEPHEFGECVEFRV
ncbi:MAG: alpha-glucan family phosphorylase, partial [Planctomycetota bacterium]